MATTCKIPPLYAQDDEEFEKILETFDLIDDEFMAAVDLVNESYKDHDEY